MVLGADDVGAARGAAAVVAATDMVPGVLNALGGIPPIGNAGAGDDVATFTGKGGGADRMLPCVIAGDPADVWVSVLGDPGVVSCT